MKRSLRKISLIFFFIALLPVSFIIYELSSLNKNEKIIREIYENQLDAILFSVNQYADDQLSSWANKINVALMDRAAFNIDSSIVLADITSLYGVFLDDDKGNAQLHVFPTYKEERFDFENTLHALTKRYSARIDKLVKYSEAGFRKMDPIDTVLFDRFIPVMFVPEQRAKEYHIAVVLLDIPAFVQNNLGPKMQAIAQDNFEIAVLRQEGSRGTLIYSTLGPNESNAQGGAIERTGFSKKLWLLPGYSLAIELKNATINDLVNNRMRTSWIILVLLMVVLVSGLIFLFRNIRSEIRLSEAKTEFVSNVSHEIRTPLALISMYAETLEMNRVSEEKKLEYYGIISSETARLSGIVNRILNFSKMDANKKEYTMRMEDLNDLCEQVLKSFNHHMERNGFTFELVQNENIPLVEIDHESIGEALINLLDNAMKYSAKVKHITIRTGLTENSVYVEVQDQGIGIPKAYQKDIFDQFYRAPMGNVHNTKGSGLGLSLVRKTMLAHKGSVTVQSALDMGSTFRLNFPILSVSV